MESIGNKICKSESLSYSKSNLRAIIEFSNYDINRFINILQELSYHTPPLKIKYYLQNARSKNIDIELFTGTYNIINNFKSYNDIIKIYESEKVLMPRMINEYHLKKILSDSTKSLDETLKIASKSSNSICIADSIETMIYIDQQWILQSDYGFYSCVVPSYYSNMNNNYTIPINSIVFSTDLNKSSLKSMKKKYINDIQTKTNKTSLNDLLIMNSLGNKLCKKLNIIS
jgi:hypothetical protein